MTPMQKAERDMPSLPRALVCRTIADLWTVYDRDFPSASAF
jgi:hypothetical protein